MDAFQSFFWIIQRCISLIGVLIIFTGVLLALFHFIKISFLVHLQDTEMEINNIRLRLARMLTLGLEFIVAADLIGTTTAPDYYTVGILAIIVLIRTLLSYTLGKELNNVSVNSSPG